MPNNFKKILVIEDEESVRKVIVNAVHDLKCEVMEAKDGKQGLDLALSRHPDLIILDLIMPKMAGQQVCKELRADAWGKNAHIIVLTNLDSKTEKDELVNLKVDEYLVKSNHKLEDVVQIVKTIINI
ncbi:MAG: response regulator [Patescibacteria group bacterium]